MAKRAEWRSGVIIVFILAAAVFGALIVRSALDSSDELPLTGRVIIQDPDNLAVTDDTCAGTGTLTPLASGARIVIAPTGHEPVETALEPGTLTDAGTCELAFTSATVPQSTVYRFTIDGLPELRHDHYLIDRQGDRGRLELAPILRWD